MLHSLVRHLGEIYSSLGRHDRRLVARAISGIIAASRSRRAARTGRAATLTLVPLPSGSQRTEPELAFGFRCANDGACVHIDPGWVDVIGAAPYRGRAWLKTVHPHDRPMVKEAYEQAIARRIPTRYRCRVRGVCGDVWVTVTMRPVAAGESKNPGGFVGLLTLAAKDVPLPSMHGTG